MEFAEESQATPDTSSSEEESIVVNDASRGSRITLVIRGGRIRLQSFSDNSTGDNPRSSYFRDLGGVSRCGTALEYVRDNPPVYQGVDKTDIGREILLNGGGHLSKCRLSSMLRHREYASGRTSSVAAIHTQMGCRLLPNRSSLLQQDRSRIFIGRFSVKGDIFVTCCQSGKITIRRLEGRQLVPQRVIQGRSIGWSILDFAFSPDEQLAVYSSWCESLHMININESEGGENTHVSLSMSPDPHEHFCAFSLQFSSDNRQIMAGCNHGRICIYDRLRGACNLAFTGHDNDVNSTCFGDDSSNVLFSGSDDYSVKAWDRRTLSEANPTPVAVFGGHYRGVTCVAARGDGRYVISNGKDHRIKLWDVRRPSGGDVVLSTQRAAQLRGGGSGGPFNQWYDRPPPLVKEDGDTSVMTYRGHRTLHTLIRCAFSPPRTTGQRYIYTGSAFGACVIYDVLTGDVVAELQGHSEVVRDVSWHPTHPDMLTTAGWDGKVLLWQHNQTTTHADIALEDEQDTDYFMYY